MIKSIEIREIESMKHKIGFGISPIKRQPPSDHSGQARDTFFQNLLCIKKWHWIVLGKL